MVAFYSLVHRQVRACFLQRLVDADGGAGEPPPPYLAAAAAAAAAVTNSNEGLAGDAVGVSERWPFVEFAF